MLNSKALQLQTAGLLIILYYLFPVVSVSKSQLKNLPTVAFIPIAPRGAVITMDTTAIVNTTFPQESPIARGTPPIAACTVAFGSCDIIQNSISFLLSPHPRTDISAPISLNVSICLFSFVKHALKYKPCSQNNWNNYKQNISKSHISKV